MIKRSVIYILLFTAISASAQQKVIPLYTGAAPGSEKWAWDEQLSETNAFNTKAAYNVSKPTLTVYPVAPGVQNTGTAVIICPGGAFYVLSVEKEGSDAAQWFSKKGITAFVLKYRLERSVTTDPVKELIDREKNGKLELEKLPVVKMAIADGKEAIAYVRKHAAEYGILPNRIGIMGFSAGGTVAASTAFYYTAANRPDFVGAIYPFLPPALLKDAPADAPPLFVAAASDDELNKQKQNINLYNKWVTAKRPAEIHVYAKGAHGFGMNKQNIPTDGWIDRMGDWLNMLDLLKPESKTPEEDKKHEAFFAEMFKQEEQRLRDDWAFVKRYAEDNKKLPPPAPGEKRVVFIGNSITEGWINTDPDYFKSRPYVNRGTGGRTASQIMVRFREDVINLKPAAVIILAGINDIAENRGPIKLEAVFGYIASMAEMARANNIKVVLSSVLPAYDFPWKPGLNPAEKVVKLNTMIKAYADKNNIVYLDYYTPMVDSRKGLPADLAPDGIHPNLKGYKVMEPLADKAIDEALSRSK